MPTETIHHKESQQSSFLHQKHWHMPFKKKKIRLCIRYHEPVHKGILGPKKKIPPNLKGSINGGIFFSWGGGGFARDSRATNRVVDMMKELQCPALGE